MNDEMIPLTERDFFYSEEHQEIWISCGSSVKDKIIQQILSNQNLAKEYYDLLNNKWFRDTQYQKYLSNLKTKSNSHTYYFATPEGWQEWLEREAKYEILDLQKNKEKFKLLEETHTKLVDRIQLRIKTLIEDQRRSLDLFIIEELQNLLKESK